MVVLDSSFIIDYFNKNEQAVNHFWRLSERQEDLATTAINMYELMVGIRKSPHKEKNRKAIDDFRAISKVLPVDLKASDIAARIQDDLSARGEIIDDFDIFIAAVCIANKEKLVTRNIRDFERIKDLEIETY